MTTAPSEVLSPLGEAWQSHPAEILSIGEEMDSVSTYRMRFRDPELARSYRFKPGQFNMLYVPGCGEVAISHSGPPGSDTQDLVHTIRVVGRVTEAIRALKVGDTLGVRGPFGNPWPLETYRGRGFDIFLVAGGLGLAPLRPVIYQLLKEREHYGRVGLLIGARSPTMLLYSEELHTWSSSGIEIQCTVDRADQEWHGSVGTVPLLIDRLRGARLDRMVMFICGPEVMMHYSAQSAIRLGFDPSVIWVSMERNMQCGFGHCGHCQWGSLFLCKDGPVVRWDMAFRQMQVRDL